MRKFISTIMAIAMIAIAGLMTTSCIVDINYDSTIRKSTSYEYSSKGIDPKPGVTSSEIDVIVNKIWNSQDAEYMGEYIVLRSQHNGKATRTMAEKIGAEIESAIKKQWPDISSQLSEDYKSLSYSVSYEFNGKEETVWTYKIR